MKTLKRYILLFFLASMMLEGMTQTHLAVQDTRSVSSTPSSYSSSFEAHFKYGSVIGLSESNGNTFYGVLGLRAWTNDNSGGKAHELAFANDGQILFRSGNSPTWEGWRKLIISDENENVGIRTLSPSSNLHIGNAQGSGITLSYDASNSYRAQIIPYWNSNKDSRIDFNINNSVGLTPSTIMSVGYDGNVGIGTTTPTEKLSVNGKIRAQEIKVEASPWPDYVFIKDYQLPSLQQTENHIKEKGHLPGIPSAAEVKANGIDLGEMNAKLLQKIEELTLHLIEMEKKYSIQQKLSEKQNKEFSTTIRELKSKIK